MRQTLFSVEFPCRCGYNGVGIHQCHYGRGIPGRRCPEAGIEFLAQPTAGSPFQIEPGMLTGTIRSSILIGCYCERHKTGAGFGNDPGWADGEPEEVLSEEGELEEIPLEDRPTESIEEFDMFDDEDSEGEIS